MEVKSKPKCWFWLKVNSLIIPQKGQKPKRVNHIIVQVISNLKSNTITSVVKEQVEKYADLITDDSTSYTKLIEHVNSHIAK